MVRHIQGLSGEPELLFHGVPGFLRPVLRRLYCLLVLALQRIPLLMVRHIQGLSGEPELLFHDIPGFLGLGVRCRYG